MGRVECFICRERVWSTPTSVQYTSSGVCKILVVITQTFYITLGVDHALHLSVWGADLSTAKKVDHQPLTYDIV